MSRLSPDAHQDACDGLRRAVGHLDRGDRELAALEVLASCRASAAATEAGELESAQDTELQHAAREILLVAVRGTPRA